MYVLPSLFSPSLSHSVSVHSLVRSHLTISALSALQWLVCSSRRRQSETSSLITLRYYPLDCSDRRWQRLWFPPITFTSLSSLESLRWTAGAADRHTHTCTCSRKALGSLAVCIHCSVLVDSLRAHLCHMSFIFMLKKIGFIHQTMQMMSDWIHFDPKIMYSCRWI